MPLIDVSHDPTMGIPHNFHDSIAIKDFVHSGWVWLVGGALAGLALVSIAAFTAVGPSSSLGSTVQPATTPLASSALLDGERFAVLVDEAIAGVDVPRSALLDGERFAVLVDEAVAETRG